MGQDKTANYLTMIGHSCTDINQGALSAILPFLLVAHQDFTYTDLVMLVFAANIASAVIQPLFGWLGDKHPSPWFMALGVFLAGLGMTAIGFAQDYWLIVVSAMVSGIGVAMFHPEGGRLANLAAGVRKGNGMSIFAVGGTVGFFVGPLLTAVFLGNFGMRGTFVFIVPATLCAIVLLAFNKRFANLGKSAKASARSNPAVDRWGRFAPIMGVVSLRSIIQYGLFSFIPLFMMNVLGQSETFSSLTISVFSVFGAIATALSGRTAERFGASRLMITCLGATAAFICVLALSQSVIVALCAAMLLAVTTDLFYASTVALGMSYVPNSLGMAAGLTYGIAVCAGGVAEPFLGMAGDTFGLPTVMMLLAACSVLAMATGLFVVHAQRRDTAAMTAQKEAN